jgi:DNA-binding transcriptional regulator YhcF (GntR family)
MPLDPNNSRPPYVQVANALRAAILTKQYVAGDQLPSGAQLADAYGVARMTVQQALRLLRQEGLIVSRQGSGVFVRERTGRPIELRPVIEAAFGAEAVTIDFFGLSGETLHAAVQEPLDQVRAGRLTPRSITIRMLLPDTTVPWGLPAAAEDLEDDPAFRERAEQIIRRHTEAVRDSVLELVDLGLIATGAVDVRRIKVAPLFKLYLINTEHAFFGYYPVARHDVRIDGQTHPIVDLMGKDAHLFRYSTADGDQASDHLDQAAAWFDSIWSVAPHQPHG